MKLNAKVVIVVFCMLAGGCVQSGANVSSPKYPVIYDTRLQSVPLSDAQINWITEEARRVAPKNNGIWFALVHHSYVSDKNESSWNATVFYRPTTTTARIRKGQCLYLRSEFKRLNEAIAAIATQPQAQEPSPLADYVQVSLRDAPFGRTFEPPPYQLWPFPLPEGFSDDELVDLVDFARTSPRVPEQRKEMPNGGFSINLGGIPFDGAEPIYSICLLEGGIVEVRSGAAQDMLAGAGRSMKCVKRDGKWIVLETGLWMI